MAVVTQTFDDQKFKLVPIEPTWDMIAKGCPPGECIDNADMGTAYRAMLAAAPSAPQEPKAGGRYAELRNALADLPAIAPWFVVGPPWGKGDFVVAGHPDPHLGEYVADTEDFDGDKPHSLEYAAWIAAANPAVIRDLLAERDRFATAPQEPQAAVDRTKEQS